LLEQAKDFADLIRETKKPPQGFRAEKAAIEAKVAKLQQDNDENKNHKKPVSATSKALIEPNARRMERSSSKFRIFKLRDTML
jgi:hypothetical protein